MSRETRLNKRAASLPDLLPLWHIGETASLFAGPLQFNAPHRHSVPVLVTGLHERFAIRVGHGKRRSVDAAMVPAGISYELDVGGKPVVVLYLEPRFDSRTVLKSLLSDTCEEGGALLGRCREVRVLRAVFENPTSARWAHEAVDDLIVFGCRHGRADGLDSRIMRAATTLRSGRDLGTATSLAAGSGISLSRFQHLFSENVGVPFRKYRSWCRLRMAITEIIAGGTLTTAAHGAGFADQAHFSRVFRATFGAVPSGSLADVRR